MSVRPRLLLAAAAALGLLVLIVLVAGAGRHRVSGAPRTLEIEMRASAGTMAQLFWADDLRFVEEQSISIRLQPPPEGLQLLRFPLPSRAVRWLRLDPTDAPGEVLIGKVTLRDANRQILQTLDPATFTPANQIASITREGDVTRVVTAPVGGDPYLFVSLGCRDSDSLSDRLALVTPLALLLASAAAAALLIASVVVIGVSVFERAPNSGLAYTSGESWRLAALWMAALFLVVFSVKLLLMRVYPLMVPFMDQWDAEARAVFIPFHACGLSWDQMFYLHNEHRVFFTRLLALALLVANAQWDPRLEQVVNAAMPALAAVLVAAVFWIANERRRLDLIVLIAALTFALPFAWENTLEAFQSAFYFQLLFAVLALWLMTTYRAGTGAWCLGWSCAVCGVFTAAGGVLTPVAIAGVLALKVADDWREWRGSLTTLVAAGAVLGVGIAAASPPLAHHAVLKATTMADFVGALGRNLAWPWVNQPELSVVMWLPIAALLLVVARRRGKSSRLERLVLGLGLWVALQAGAIAYGRGAGAPVPATRYQDFLSLGFVANTMVIVAFMDRAGEGMAARRLAGGVLASWLFVSMVGVDRLVEGAFADLNVWRDRWSAQAANVRRFIATDDYAAFTSGADVPYPDAQNLASVLQDPYIRRILPAAVREPVRIEPRAVTNDAFVPDGAYPITPRDPIAREWGSFSSQGNPAEGRFESQPARACELGGYLEFPVAGYLGLPQQYLAVKEQKSGREMQVTPGKLAREDWVGALVSCPRGPYAIIAVDNNPDYWFAFREPVEVGRVSPMAESLITASPELLFAALAMAVLAARRT